MTIEFVKNLSNYSQWLGSFLIAFLVFRKYSSCSKEIKIIGIVALVSIIFQSMQNFSLHFLNMLYLNAIGDCYVYLESLLLFTFYYLLFVNNRIARFLVVVAAITSSSIYVLVNVGDPSYPWYAVLSSTEGALLILFSVMLFFKLVKDLPQENLLDMPVFWINAAVLFFYSCTFMLSLTMDYIAQILRNDFTIFWTFHNFLRACFCMVICIGIWKARKLNNQSNDKSNKQHSIG